MATDQLVLVDRYRVIGKGREVGEIPARVETETIRHGWFAGGRYSIADGYTHCAGDGGFDLERYLAVRAWLRRVAAKRDHIPLSAAW